MMLGSYSAVWLHGLVPSPLNWESRSFSNIGTRGFAGTVPFVK